MKKLVFPSVIITLILLFANCNGNNRAHKNNNEILEASKLTDSFYERIEYFPNEYTEITTDTILKSGFRVKTKTYSDMQNNYLVDFKIDSIHYKHYYRSYAGKLEVLYNNAILVDETINKSLFFEVKNKDFWESAIMGQVALDEFNTTKDMVYISVFYCIPESEICKDYQIIIDKLGNKSIKKLTEEPIH